MISHTEGTNAIKAASRTKVGRTALDYLVQESGYYDSLSNTNPVKEQKAVAVRDFAIEHIVKTLTKQEK